MSDTNLAVQPQRMARGLKFRIKAVDGLYYLCSENKGICPFVFADAQIAHLYVKNNLSFEGTRN